MRNREHDTYRSWLGGELALVSVLAFATIALWQTHRLDGYELPRARLALETTVAVLSLIVAILAATRFRVEGRAMDLVLSVGFGVAALGAIAFSIVPDLTDLPTEQREQWAAVGCRILSGIMIAVAPFLGRRLASRAASLWVGVAFGVVVASAIWGIATLAVPEVSPYRPKPFGRHLLRPARGVRPHRHDRVRPALPAPRARPRQLARDRD